MMVQGSLSVKLINATTMKPFAEHCSSIGKVFVTMNPHDGFFVHMKVHGKLVDERSIFFKTFVSSSSCTSTIAQRPRNSFKRTNNGDNERNVFRFETTAQPYESMARGQVTVRIYERLSSNTKKSAVTAKRRFLESVTIHCLVVPSEHPEVGQMANCDAFTTDATSLLLSMDTLQSKKLTALQSPSWLKGENYQAPANPLLAPRIMPEKLHLRQSLQLIL
jgi:hypothetical protein